MKLVKGIYIARLYAFDDNVLPKVDILFILLNGKTELFHFLRHLDGPETTFVLLEGLLHNELYRWLQSLARTLVVKASVLSWAWSHQSKLSEITSLDEFLIDCLVVVDVFIYLSYLASVVRNSHRKFLLLSDQSWICLLFMLKLRFDGVINFIDDALQFFNFVQ